MPGASLDTPVLLCQLDNEFQACLRLYRELEPVRVLEIGTASGGTLYHWLTAYEPDAVVSVDLPEPDYPLDRDQCHEWAADHTDLYLVEGDSHDPNIIERVRERGPYDFVFIDGNHRYQHAKADLDAYWPMVTPDGLLCLHDINLVRRYEDGTVAGVRRLFHELRAAGHWTLELSSPTATGEYGIGVVRGHSQPVMP